MSLGHSLLESGVEMEMTAEIQDVISLLDSEVPHFSHEAYGYRITSVKGVLDTQCALLLTKALGPAGQCSDTTGRRPAGDGQSGRETHRLPAEPLYRGGRGPLEGEEALFVSLVSQLVHAFQSNGLMDLPGPTPAR